MKLLLVFSIIFHGELSNLGVGHVQYLSPEKAEDQYIGTLANHKDDEFIYTFGLKGQEDPELVDKFNIPFSKYEMLCKVIESIMTDHDVKFETNNEEDPLE